jgi:serine protease Do
MNNQLFKILSIYFVIFSFNIANALNLPINLSKNNTKNLPSFSEELNKVLPTVVNITTSQEQDIDNKIIEKMGFQQILPEEAFEELKKQFEQNLRVINKSTSLGSGFIVSSDGFIVTNYHVVDYGNKIMVALHDNTKFQAKIVGFDKKSDIALLKIDRSKIKDRKPLPFVKFADSNQAKIGDWVIVVGNPYGLGNSASVGIVSYRGRDIGKNKNEEFIQTDAAINKGNSGGPMFNLNGEVVGMSTIIFSPSGGSVGIGFATPSNTITKIVKDLQERGEVVRGWIGVAIHQVDEEILSIFNLQKLAGVLVTEVISNSPAENAGVRVGDIILKFNKQEITDIKLLPKLVSQSKVNEDAILTIARGSETLLLKIKISKMQDEKDKKPTKDKAKRVIGMELAKISSIDNDQQQQLIIRKIEENSIAYKQELQINDIIISVNQKNIGSFEDLERQVEESVKSKKSLLLIVRRDQNNLPIIINLNKQASNELPKPELQQNN